MKICFLISLICFGISACVPHSSIHPEISGPGWRADKIGHYPTNDKYFIVALDHQAADAAQKDICDQGKYICSIQPLQSFVIERNRK